MTIRAGAIFDEQVSISLFNIDHDAQYVGGAVLTGFGTKPIPGAICDDPIPRVIGFTAHHLQRVLKGLLERKVTDMAYAKQMLSVQLSKINDSINYINRNIGQGVYITGVVCYVAEEKYICLPFGGSYAYLWTGNELVQQKNQFVQFEDPLYIYDALGGGNSWTAIFEEGQFPVGAQLLCMTKQPPEGLLESTMTALTHTNQEIVATNLHSGLPQGDIPRAVLNIAQAANYQSSKKEEASTEG